MALSVSINGKAYEVTSEADTPLLWVLRDELGLTGTKFGCGAALCGACSVHLDGETVRSCQLTVGDAVGRDITTIEGINGPVADAVQKAWRDLDVVQCGYCQSGQIMSAVGLLSQLPKPSDEEITQAMDGHVCRCATYHRIRAAIHSASKSLG